MPQDNYSALGQGMKLYTDAMRRLVKERLSAAYGGKWWQAGVVDSLTTQQAHSLRQDMKREPAKDPLDHLDPNHFVRIVARNFDAVFRSLFGDYQRTQSWLMQVATARNAFAHPRSGDLPKDDVAHSLYAMVQILECVGLPEAQEVELLRKQVLGMQPESTLGQREPEPKPPWITAPAPSGELPYWWQVCEPHDAFKNPATIDESLFAATLGGVHAGAARPDYLDPAVFFSHTYFTENLKLTIRDVASRLAGGDGPAVTEMQTPFGGGKTHALLALYHLIRNPERSLAVPGVQEALGDVQIPSGARVLVFDGQEFGTDPVEKENGAAVWTMWGELAFQADRSLYQTRMIDVDQRGEAPGNALFRQVLQAASPCLFLVDELVSYLVKLKFANARRTQNLYRQTVQFVQELLQEAGNARGVCVLLSLPKSKREFGGLDAEELQLQLGVVPDLQVRTDRVVSKRTPVNDDEIYTLMSTRLFKRADRSAATQVARMYRSAYERTRALYNPGIFSEEYLRQQIAAYPLHPELIDVLYKKWSTAADFPRTRAVLQLLANVVADQWVHRREAYAIQSAHVSLERERIRTRIVSAAGSGYDAVVAADIIGGEAHADVLDQGRNAEYERYQIARGVATTLLMHSFGGQTRAGALPPELYLGSVAPNVGPEYVSEVLDSLEQSLWYVHREGELRRFQTRPNIYRIIAQRAEAQPGPTVAERLREALRGAIGTSPDFRILEWAGADGVIPDRPEASVAILPPRYAVLQESEGTLAGREPIDRLWEKAGGGLREWRNALILVAPDAELWAKAEEAMREVMAYEAVVDDAEKSRLEVSQGELKELRSRHNDKKESLRTSITTAYRWVFSPGEQGLDVLPLPIPAIKDERIVGRVIGRLSDQNYGHPKVMLKIGAAFFASRLAPRLWKDEASPLDLEEASRRFLQWTYLPILPRREESLAACVREGVKDGRWAVAIGDNSAMSYQRLIENPDDLDSASTLFDGSASLVKGELLELLREEHRGRIPSLGEQPPTPPTPGQDGGNRKVIAPQIAKPPVIPPPPKRLSKVCLRLDAFKIAKTTNLQPYLFKVLQEQDPAAEVTLTIEVKSAAGISAEVLDQRIVEGFDQLGITIRWERE